MAAHPPGVYEDCGSVCGAPLSFLQVRVVLISSFSYLSFALSAQSLCQCMIICISFLPCDVCFFVSCFDWQVCVMSSTYDEAEGFCTTPSSHKSNGHGFSATEDEGNCSTDERFNPFEDDVEDKVTESLVQADCGSPMKNKRLSHLLWRPSVLSTWLISTWILR